MKFVFSKKFQCCYTIAYPICLAYAFNFFGILKETAGFLFLWALDRYCICIMLAIELHSKSFSATIMCWHIYLYSIFLQSPLNFLLAMQLETFVMLVLMMRGNYLLSTEKGFAQCDGFKKKKKKQLCLISASNCLSATNCLLGIRHTT